MGALLCVRAEEIRVATWNCDMNFGRTPNREQLDAFNDEVAPDILLLQELHSPTALNHFFDLMDRTGDEYVISNFNNGDGDNEVTVISRFRIGKVIEFDSRPEANDPYDKTLKRANQDGIAKVGVGRGFLIVELPDLKLFVVNTHLKSSRGKSGLKRDLENAQKRELVAAAAVVEITSLLETYPEYTVVFGGDLNVGVLDEDKNGNDLKDDFVSSGIGYDETHAILSNGLIKNTVKMNNLCEGMQSTYGKQAGGAFPKSGAIDCLYYTGPLIFTKAVRMEENFGSDHKPVYSTVNVDIDLTGEEEDIEAVLDEDIYDKIKLIEMQLLELKSMVGDLPRK